MIIFWRPYFRAAYRINIWVYTANVTYVSSCGFLLWSELFCHRPHHSIRLWLTLCVLSFEYHLHSFFELLIYKYGINSSLTQMIQYCWLFALLLLHIRDHFERNILADEFFIIVTDWHGGIHSCNISSV